MAPIPTRGLAASSPEADLAPMDFVRHEPGPYDVVINVKYCGVCHSDVHCAKNDMGGTMYPCVPGHEAAGVVASVGSEVTKVAVGDHVGVGCFVDSCLECGSCKAGDEQYCEKGMTMTYNSKPAHGRAGPADTHTKGGYSKTMVVQEHFVIKVPKDYPLECAGPIMCAAITMWDPLRHWGAKPGMRVGFVGIGGLGMMGIKLAKAMGCEVTAITSSPGKVEMCKKIGADNVVVSSDPDAMEAASKSLDLILNSVSATHEVQSFVGLLNTNGTIVQLGLVTDMHSVSQLPLIMGRKSIAGSVIAGIKSSEECMEFVHKHQIKPEIEIVSCDKINDVYATLMTKNDAVKRYVLDIENTLMPPGAGMAA